MWKKSSFSSAADNCVEIQASDDVVLVRNSKRTHLDPTVFTRGEISAFVAGVKAGEFDEFC